MKAPTAKEIRWRALQLFAEQLQRMCVWPTRPSPFTDHPSEWSRRSEDRLHDEIRRLCNERLMPLVKQLLVEAEEQKTMTTATNPPAYPSASARNRGS